MNSIKTLVAIIFSFHSASALATEYLECDLWGGQALKAKFIIDTNTLGAMFLLDSAGPFSYVSGREGDSIQIMVSPDHSAITFDMESTFSGAPKITAILKPKDEDYKFYDMKVFVIDENQVSVQFGSCIKLLK